jgi:hypothetical protein
MYIGPQGLEVVVVRAADPFDYTFLAPCAVIPAFAWGGFGRRKRGAFYFSLLVERAANCGAPICSSHSLVYLSRVSPPTIAYYCGSPTERTHICCSHTTPTILLHTVGVRRSSDHLPFTLHHRLIRLSLP